MEEKLKAMAEKWIELRGISKIFDGVRVLDHLNLDIHENEFVTLLGPSGCGKTTTLRILGGFEKADEGVVLLNGSDISHVPANKRPINTVFQKYALFSHMNIAENIAFGLKIKKKSKQYISDKIRYALRLVNLEGFEKRMQYELIRLKEELGITFVYVTHDQEEALTMSDRIVVMNQGYIQQVGTPEDIYNEPQNAFVADFIGDSNLLPAVMVCDKKVNIQGQIFDCVDVGFGMDNPVDVVIRPEDMILVPLEQGTIKGRVVSLIFKGVHYEMEVEALGTTWLVHSTQMAEVGTEVGLFVDPFNIQIMKKPENAAEEVLHDDE